ncbi:MULTISPECIES: ABC transporter ATP-binding protein [unclassified Paenibacillus]|uniref:ABC transporter ATP-binding protein n=1 Tax=unclassified Paenibacillus TaxID=185978 RepID=UPI0030F784EB
MGSKLLLEARGINKTFGSRKVVNNLNLSIETGDIYGFLGPNGAGKTTTIRILLGLISPDSGEVKIDGVSLRTDFKKSISAIGAMIDPAFYTYLSGYDNLRLIANLIPGMNNSNIKEVLDIVGMMERAEDKVKTYSLGMKQRLGIASALLNNPKLIILDEPTNGLDPQGMVEIRELIVHLAKEKGISFLISSHLLVEVEQICTKVGIIKEGNLLVEGNVKQLLKSDHETLVIHTGEAERALKAVSVMQYVQSAQSIPQGILVELRNGYASSLNQVMVAQQIPVEAIVPQNDTLEKFFFEIQNRGQRG